MQTAMVGSCHRPRHFFINSASAEHINSRKRQRERESEREGEREGERERKREREREKERERERERVHAHVGFFLIYKSDHLTLISIEQ